MAAARLGPDGLTDKERLLLLEYLVDGNGTRAAMAAYRCKSEKSAGVLASKILAKPRVQKALRQLLNGVDKGIRLKKRHILRSLSDSLNRDLHDFKGIVPGIEKLPKQTHCYVTGFKIRQYHDDPEHPERVTHEDIEVKLSPVAVDRDQAFRIKGMYKPRQAPQRQRERLG